MTTSTEQLKALAEAVVNNKVSGESWAREYNFQFYATPERILALIAENERLPLALDSIAIETHDDSAERIARKALGETK